MTKDIIAQMTSVIVVSDLVFVQCSSCFEDIIPPQKLVAINIREFFAHEKVADSAQESANFRLYNFPPKDVAL